MCVLPECMYVNHMLCLIPEGQKRTSCIPPKLEEWRMLGTELRYCKRSTGLLTIDPSLQPHIPRYLIIFSYYELDILYNLSASSLLVYRKTTDFIFCWWINA